MSIPEWINHLTVLKTPWNKFTPDQQKLYLPFVIDLWMSMDPQLLETISEVQQFQVPPRDHYNFYLKILPKRKMYLQWIKARKSEYTKDMINKLSEVFSVGSREISEQLHLLDKQKIINILEQTGLGDKSIAKLMK